MDGISSDTAVSAISVMASIGFAVWWGFHTTTRTLPDKEKAHREEMRSLILDMKEREQSYRNDMKEMRAEFTAALKEVTDHCEVELQAISENYRRETDRLAEEIKKSASFRPVEP